MTIGSPARGALRHAHAPHSVTSELRQLPTVDTYFVWSIVVATQTFRPSGGAEALRGHAASSPIMRPYLDKCHQRGYMPPSSLIRGTHSGCDPQCGASAVLPRELAIRAGAALG